MKTMLSLYNKVHTFLTRKEEGASLVEYGLLVALIAVVCIAAITLLGGSLSTMFTGISGAVDAAGP